MKNPQKISALLCSIVLGMTLGCGEPVAQQDSHQSWLTGGGPARGHEDLTRLGVERANGALIGLIGSAPYPSIAKGVAGIDSGNSMIQGNYESDFPADRMYNFHGVPFSTDWHHDGSIQHVHSLRDKINGAFVSNQDACIASRNNIRRAAQLALESYRLGQRESTLYWLGHASHVIQDSFSPAHTQRTGPGRRDIVSICTYGNRVPGACFHETVDVKDRVWKDSFSCQLDANNRGSSCLKDEAKNAVEATGSFLRNVGEAIFGGKDLEQSLQNFFVDRSVGDQGYFICEGLNG